MTDTPVEDPIPDPPIQMVLSGSLEVAAPNAKVAAAHALLDGLRELSDRFDLIVAAMTRSKHVQRLVMLSVAFDICLTGFSFWTSHVATSAASKAHNASVAAAALASETHANAVTSCKNSNVVRADDIRLWTFALNQSPSKTAAEKASTENLQVFVNKTFAPAVCK
jgi:hypothetical protein